MLNLGAVDYLATVYINGKEIGTHEGGYTEFSFDITYALQPGSNEIIVKVYHPSDAGIGPRGKQVLNPRDIYYTPFSGIWQTVWLESVPKTHIQSVNMTPDIDKGILHLDVNVSGATSDFTIVTSIGNKRNGVEWNTNSIDIPIKSQRLWSPADPYLYVLHIALHYKGEEIDYVKTYFGMRKIEVKKHSDGYDRIFLNNQPFFNLGTLDQGFWPDGLHTAATDEALAFDIKAIKAIGFNTIRKHIKVEPYAFQVDGENLSKEFGWRLFNLDLIDQLVEMKEIFIPSRDYSFFKNDTVFILEEVV